jgi:hypothetical protein
MAEQPGGGVSRYTLGGREEPTLTGLAKAFAHFQAVGSNPRWSWSARSPDGKTVVMTLWKDLIQYKDGKIFYDAFGRKYAPQWVSKLGNRERLEKLKWTRDHCDELFRVVIVVAKNVKASPRAIAQSYPQERMVMRLIELNEETGEFRAVNVR